MYVWLVKFVFYAGKRYQFMITRCSKLAVKKINLDEFDFELYVSFFLFFFFGFLASPKSLQMLRARLQQIL